MLMETRSVQYKVTVFRPSVHPSVTPSQVGIIRQNGETLHVNNVNNLALNTAQQLRDCPFVTAKTLPKFNGVNPRGARNAGGLG